MYEEGSKKLSINWLSLVIKLLILGLFVFLLCWLFTRNKSSNKNDYLASDTDFSTYITAMKEAADDYFTDSKLPEDLHGTETITLRDMLNQKLLIDFTDNGEKCDLTNSYAQVTKSTEDEYSLKVNLVCGNKSDFIISAIKKTECPNNNCLADNNSTNNQNTTNTTNNSNNSNSNSNSTPKVTTKVKVTITCNSCNNKPEPEKKPTPDKTLYYQYYRYTNWMDGYSSDPNAEVERKEYKTYDYCLQQIKTIYSTSYITNPQAQNYHYTIQFTNFTANDVINDSVYLIPTSPSYFSSSLVDYERYINTKIYDPYGIMVGNPDSNNMTGFPDATTFRNSSLTRNNFSFNVGNIYKIGNYYYIDININVRNVNGVTPNGQKYYVPLKFNIGYAYKNQCIRDTEANSYKYSNYLMVNPEVNTYYRYRLKEYIWSTDPNLAGWTYTGVSEYR